MNFLLDHDVPVEIGRVLSQADHGVVYVSEALSCRATDSEVFEYGVAQQLVLLTCNRDDFLRLAHRRRHHGLVIVIRRRTRIAECAHVLRLLKAAGMDGIVGNINFA